MSAPVHEHDSSGEISFVSHTVWGETRLSFDIGEDGAVYVAVRFSTEHGEDQRMFILESPEQAMLTGWLMAQLAKSGTVRFSDDLTQKVREARER